MAGLFYNKIVMKRTLMTAVALITFIFMGVQPCSAQKNNAKKHKNVYEFTVQTAEGETVSLSKYQGKVLLIVNTASRCGFTPQYEELESMYAELQSQGFEILDFPCNQFGQQAPESDADYVAFCKANFDTHFTQFHKIDVNGDAAIELYQWLKFKKGFAGFDPAHPLTPILEQIFDKNIPGWRKSPDIKWNFTKFLVDREGHVIARFEPTATKETMMPAIKKALGAQNEK